MSIKKKYQVTLLIDASAYVEVEAENAEQAYSIAADIAGHVTLCHQCTDEVETGDCYGAHVYSEYGDEVEFTRESDLESQLAALKEDNERLRTDNETLRAESAGWRGAANKYEADLAVASEKLETMEYTRSEKELSLEARVTEQSEYILHLRKSIIDATNCGAQLDSGKWVYLIDDSVLEWPSALKNQPMKVKKEIPAFLLEMSKQMREQDNRCTAHPFWQVRCIRHIPTDEGYYSVGYELVTEDGDVVYRSYRAEEDELETLLLEHYREHFESMLDDEETAEDAVVGFDPTEDDLPDGLRLVYVQEIEHVVSTHLTQADAKWFIRRKQHDYPPLYTYVESAYWAPQLRELQDWIISLTADELREANNEK